MVWSKKQIPGMKALDSLPRDERRRVLRRCSGKAFRHWHTWAAALVMVLCIGAGFVAPLGLELGMFGVGVFAVTAYTITGQYVLQELQPRTDVAATPHEASPGLRPLPVGRAEEESEWIVLYPSLWKAFFVLLVSLALAAVGIALVPHLKELGVVRGIVVSCFLISLGAVSAVASVYRLVTRRPLLVINHEGLFVKSSPVLGWFLRWEEIRGLGVYRRFGSAVLRVFPVDPSVLLRQHGRLGKLFMWLILGEHDSLLIPQTLLPMKATEVAEQIEKRYGVQVRTVSEWTT
jgi:hypothetical protein